LTSTAFRGGKKKGGRGEGIVAVRRKKEGGKKQLILHFGILSSWRSGKGKREATSSLNLSKGKKRGRV